jgi:hypothetical protein
MDRGVVTAIGSTDAVITFSIKSVLPTDRELGLAGLELMSAAVTVEPDRPCKIDGDQGIGVELCIADGPAQGDGERCASILSRLTPYSSQTLSNDLVEVAGGCTKGTSCGCACAFRTPHLTTFVVGDAEQAALGEVSVDQLAAGLATLAPAPEPAPTPAPSNTESSGFPAAAVAGVAAVAAVALVAFVGAVRKRCSAGANSAHTPHTHQAEASVRHPSTGMQYYARGDKNSAVNPLHPNNAEEQTGVI